MQIHRFFVEPYAECRFAKLDKNDALHALRVLRLGKGDKVIACDGRGNDYDALITETGKDFVLLSLSNKRLNETESQYNITLLQGVPKAGKMDFIIQKCVEIGINRIIPINTMRSVVKPDKDKSERYNRLALEAAKQSGRGIIPEVLPVTKFAALDYSVYDLLIIAYEEEKLLSVKRLIESVDRTNTDFINIAIVIGPEGGLDISEVEYLKAQGGHTVTLGKRILRTETAGMVASAIVLSELER